jgi:TatD DNase family protein
LYIDIHTHRQPGIGDVLQVSNLYSGFGRVVEGMLCSIGLHPWYLQDSKGLLMELNEFAAYKNVLAIGECGLDKVCETEWILQEGIFREQVALAKSVKKPIIIHCVRAFAEVMQVLDEIQPGVPVIFHGFNRNRNIADKLLQKGYCLSFGAAVLKDGAVADVVSEMPGDRFFCETDDAAIEIADIYHRVAELRETPVDDIILQVEENFKKVFKRNIV